MCWRLEQPCGLLSVPFAVGIKSKVLEGLGGVVQCHGCLDLIEGGNLRVLMFALPAVNQVIGQQSLKSELTLLLLLLVSFDQFCVPIEEIIA